MASFLYMFHKQSGKFFFLSNLFLPPFAYNTALLMEKDECNQPRELGNFNDFAA